ncbi:MAG TPA: TonB-dependent receptor [Terriglobia bacterium]|nr:TonB-dependent receptor [Terriglobia bacterium]
MHNTDRAWPFLVAILLAATLVCAASDGVLKGIVHDPQHRPIARAQVAVRAQSGAWSTKTQSDANGEFELDNVPEGDYIVTVTAPGFGNLEQPVSVVSGKAPVTHFQMELAAMTQTVQVSGTERNLTTQSSTVQNYVSSQEITETPGADQTNSLSMITNFTPGAYMVHDMLHMRGGHQVNWFFDGIPVINTNIAANIAPLINPKNVDSLEVERGGYSAEYGDRTYGFFNVLTPSGFESNNQGQLILSYGNFNTTDDQLSFGGHTSRFAYYASLDGNRSDLGLATPVPEVIHDQTSGLGGFLSLLYNPSASDQVRWIVSLRGDHYQIPNSPDDQAAGLRDLDLERDYLAGFQWVHSTSSGLIFSVSPYYHFNSAQYLGGPGDMPFVLDDNDRSNYVGVRAVLQAHKKKHNAQAGVDIWGQHDNAFFGLSANPGSQVLQQQELNWANSESLFLSDQYQPLSWLTLDLGMRLQHYGGLVSENAADPRLGGSIRLPRLNWILHGYYAYYYQPPPLNSLTGPLLQFALDQGFGFTPLPGERDIQYDFGLTVPLRGWSLGVDNFHTNARNFLDHDVIGNSGIFVPLSDLAALIDGTEVTLRSPEIFNRAQLRVAYSNQIAKGLGPITGGLIEDTDEGYFLLDHDQRNTANAVLSLKLPRRFWSTAAVNYGSGFLNDDGPMHLPAHTTADISLGKSLGESWTFSVNATNVFNSRYLLDNSNTFGGTHWVNPRQIYGELRYRFHF